MYLLKLFIIQFFQVSVFLLEFLLIREFRQKAGLPGKDYVFKIERSRDADKIYCQANHTHVYRIRDNRNFQTIKPDKR